ncbi:MAG: hypothetical protein AAGI22_10140 [Planctomycetota bacterium]
MTTPTLHRLAALALAAPFAASIATAQAVLDWNAASGQLPTELVPEWLRYDSPGCFDITATLGATALVLDNSAVCPGDGISYAQTFTGPPAGNVPSTYFIEARMRVVQSADLSPDVGAAIVALAPPSFCPWFLELDQDEVVLNLANVELGAIALDTTAAVRTYRLEVDLQTGESRLLVDGVLQLSASYVQPDCSPTGAYEQHAVFGHPFDAETSVTEWESVRHNLGDGEAEFCANATQPNSSGFFSRMRQFGSLSVAANDLVLRTNGLPVGSFGYYLCSESWSTPQPIVGSQGALCLTGSIGRLNRPGEILVADAAGQVELAVDLTRLPQPNGPVAVMPGDTWHFQLWHRDANPQVTSNTSSALQLSFY